MRKKRLLIILLLPFLLAWAWVLWNGRPRCARYRIDRSWQAGDAAERAGTEARPYGVGAAAVAITPAVDYTLKDADSNGKFDPQVGDRLVEANGKEAKRPVWLAGFDAGRPATGVHDGLWARAVVFAQDDLCVAVVMLDLIGFFYHDVIDVRRSLPSDLGIDHLIIASTHNHNGPDTMGLWGRTHYRCGVDRAYLRQAKDGIRNAVQQAVADLRPAEIRIAARPTGTEGWVKDSRPPKVIDDTLTVLHCVARDSDETIATILHWSNHPECLGSDNTLLTSDFCHYARKRLEAELGGVGVYWNGAVGGLITSLGVPVPGPDGKAIQEAGFAQAEALGENLAGLALDLLHDGQTRPLRDGRLQVQAKTIFLPTDNRLLRWGMNLGIINRGYYPGRKLCTEIDRVQFGLLDLLTVPGEIYPEIVVGGVECPDGADYPGEPQEVPPLKELLTGEYKLILGLANDEVGYLIPQTEWDTQPPYIYDYHKPPYGEIVSPGPHTAAALHREIADWLGEGDA
jgi:hypothetical protein